MSSQLVAGTILYIDGNHSHRFWVNPAGYGKEKWYPYLFLLVHSNGFRGVKLVGSSMLPHALGTMCYERAIWHPTGQGEAQVHPDVIVEGPVIGRSIRTKQAVPITYFTRHRTTFPQHLPMFLNLLGGGGTHDVIEPYIPVTPVIGVKGIYDLTFNTPEDKDDIPSLNGPGFAALLRDP